MPDAVPSLAEMITLALARNPGRPAIEFEDRWHTWGELSASAAEVRQALADSGVPMQAPVVLVARNRPWTIAALLGLLAEGRTVQMVYPFQSAEAIAATIARLAPGAAILDAGVMAPPIIAALQAAGIAGLAIGAGGVEVLCPAGPEAATRAGPAEPVIEILTSGTTGPPKQFPISHRMIAGNFIGAGALEPAAQAEAAAQPPGLLYFPLGNISGVYSTLPPLVRGQRVCLLDRFSIAAWHGYVLRHRPVQSGIPPAAMRAFLDANIPREDLSSIKAMGSGAAPLDPELHRAFEARYGIPILLSYGATEFGGPVCAWTPPLHAEWSARKHGSVGRAMPGARLRVVDEASGAELPPGAEGLLEVVSPRIGPDWIRTADLGVIDADGFLWLRGRADGAIMRGGFKILPETIEAALLLHPGVAEAAVTAVPDPRLDQVPGAAVRLADPESGITQAELDAFLRLHLLATQIPVHWHFCESLPVNASHKVDRQELQRIFIALNEKQS